MIKDSVTTAARHVFFGEGERLEGIYAPAGHDRGAVISHPHPQMGGDMHNPVVRTISDSLLACGISTLRFNFRGVGKSAGSFDSGRGEQDDLLAALAFLKEQPFRETLLAGYSFGAWISAMALSALKNVQGILVAPPLELFTFAFDKLAGRISLMIGAEHDAYCPPSNLAGIASDVGCKLIIIPDTDHFFTQKETALADAIATFYKYT
jgi:alpha/beta superfamily hydrolase